VKAAAAFWEWLDGFFCAKWKKWIDVDRLFLFDKRSEAAFVSHRVIDADVQIL
jgi:hypothetical protein